MDFEDEEINAWNVLTEWENDISKNLRAIVVKLKLSQSFKFFGNA